MDLLKSFDELHEILGTTAVLLAIATGLFVGTRPWKLASLVLAFEYGVSLLLAHADRYDRVILAQSKAALVAVLLGWIVYRFRATGIVVLLGFQLFAALLRFSVWLDPTILASINALLLNAVGWAMVVTLPIGAILSRVALNR